MTYRLYNGDCLTEMKKIEDNAADITFTSPPYNMNLQVVNGKYKTNAKREVEQKGIGQKNIFKKFKYNNYDDNLPMDDYRDFTLNVIDECLRISPIVFWNVQFIAGNKKALFEVMGQRSHQLKEFIVWDKVNGQPAISAGVMNSAWEAILVFDRDNAIKRKFDNCYFERGTLNNIWHIKSKSSSFKDRSGTKHSATFNMELVETVLKNFTKPGDTVLDPFMGTGTTNYVADIMGRNSIGIEMDEEYFRFSKKRLRVKDEDNENFESGVEPVGLF